MRKRVTLSMLTAIICFALLMVLLNNREQIDLRIKVLYEQNDVLQIFWGDDIGTLNAADSFTQSVDIGTEQEITLDWSENNNIVRVDFGTIQQTACVYFMLLEEGTAKAYITENEIGLLHDLSFSKAEDGTYRFTVTGEDPYFVAEISESLQNVKDESRSGQMRNIFIYAGIALLSGLFVFWQYKRVCILLLWILEILKNRKLILELAVSDFRTRYASSYLGAVWAFVQPVVTVAIYVLVFGYGFHSTPVGGYPFVPWLVAGIIPWFYFQDSVTMATTSLNEYSYLVKKVVFEIKVLPIVKVAAAFFVHLAFLVLAAVIHAGYGYGPDIYYIQLLYYCLCATALSFGIVYLTSALNVFFQDLQQIINIILQFGIWLTPIMWDTSMFGGAAEKILAFNPMYYVVAGYRDCFYNKVPFWDKPGMTIYFWLVTIVFLALGTYVFRKLEKHFADVL